MESLGFTCQLRDVNHHDVYRPVKGVLKYRKLMFGEIKRLNIFREKVMPEQPPDRKESL